MKLSLRNVAVLSLALVSLNSFPQGGSKSMTKAQAAVAKQIFALDEKWSKTAGTHNLDGILSFYSDNAVLLPPNAPIAKTRKAIRSNWEGLAAPGGSISWVANKVDVSKSCDMAYTYGTYKLAIKLKDGKFFREVGKFLEIWQLQPNGSWKCTVDMFNSDEGGPI